MDAGLQDKVVIVTGAASGIGKALAERFAKGGARAVVVADLDGAGADAVAAGVGGLGLKVDVSNEAEVQQLVQTATERFGRVDVFCSNAGIIARADEDASNAQWQRHWDVNLMAHVYAARAVLPQMLERGEGYLVQTASAAGLLSQVNAAPYSVTKHAAVGFAEWLSIAHGDRGIRASAASRFFWLRDTSATFAPAPRKASAHASPIPLLAPVTTTTLSFNPESMRVQPFAAKRFSREPITAGHALWK